MKQLTKLGVPVGIVFIVVMLVVPLPAIVLDLLIALNITGALLVLMVVMFVARPLDFASFPAIILVTTLFRLALNVSATRLVLLARVRRQGDRHLRPLRGRRLAHRRPDRLRDPPGHPVRRHHQRCRPRRRGRRPVHPRRDARQADGHRRRPELRAHRRGPGPQAPRRRPRRGRLLRRDGRRLEVRQGRRDRGDHHHAGQPGRRLRHRGRPDGDAVRRRGHDVQPALGR